MKLSFEKNRTSNGFLSKKTVVLYFILALFVNCFWLYVSKITHNPDGSDIYISGAELEHDIRASEHFLKNGDYYFGKDFFGEDDYTYRLPGFLFVYLPFRLIFDIHGTLTAIVLLQVLLSAFATVCLSRITYNLIKKPIYYYIAFFAFLGSGYVQNHNFGLNREGLTTYILIFALYLYLRWKTYNKDFLIVIFSLLLTWSYLYRAFLVLPVMLIFIIIIYWKWQEIKKIPIKLTVILFIPSIIFFSYWIPRNYVYTKKVTILETCYVQSKANSSIRTLIKTWGGEVLPWIKNSESSWFNKPLNGKYPSDSLIPDFLFNDTLTLESLKTAREYLWMSNETSNDLKTRLQYDEKAEQIINKFTEFQVDNFPLRVYFSSKIGYLYEFLNQPIGSRTINIRYPYNILFTFTTSFINYILFFAGFIASVILLFYRKYLQKTFYNQLMIFTILFTMIVLFTIELRRVAHLVPFFLVNILILTDEIFTSQKKMSRLLMFSSTPVFLILAYIACLNNIKW